MWHEKLQKAGTVILSSSCTVSSRILVPTSTGSVLPKPHSHVQHMCNSSVPCSSTASPALGKLSTMLLLVCASRAIPSAESSMPLSARQSASPVASSLSTTQAAAATAGPCDGHPDALPRHVLLPNYTCIHTCTCTIKHTPPWLCPMTAASWVTRENACCSQTLVSQGATLSMASPVGAALCIALLHHVHYTAQEGFDRLCSISRHKMLTQLLV